MSEQTLITKTYSPTGHTAFIVHRGRVYEPVYSSYTSRTLKEQKECFSIERECLEALNKRFNCSCDKARRHFPKILKHDEGKLELTMTHCGDSIGFLCHGEDGRVEKLKHAALDLTPLPLLEDVKLFAQRHRMDKQVECIIDNLKLNKITHLDISSYNMCVNKDGDLSLIDFGTAERYRASGGWPPMIKNLRFIGGSLVRETWTPELLTQLEWNARTNDWGKKRHGVRRIVED